MSEQRETELIIYPSTPEDRASLPLLADVQFLEPFGSEALNRKFLGIIPKGIYRGFGVTIVGEDQISVGGSLGEHTALVERDGVAITVQGQNPVTLTVPRDNLMAVVIDVNYGHGVITKQVDSGATIDAATIKIVAASLREEHHVTVCEIFLPAGAALNESMIDTSVRDEGGILDTFNKDEALGMFMQKTDAVTGEDIAEKKEGEKWVSLSSLWDGIEKILSERTISVSGAMTGGGDLSGEVPLSVRNATEEQTGVVQLSSSMESTNRTVAVNEFVANALRELIINDGHSHSASAIKSGVFDANRLPDASTTSKGAVQTTDSFTSASSTLVPTAKALANAVDEMQGKSKYYPQSSSITMSRESARTIVDRTSRQDATISIRATSFEVGDEIEIHNIHPEAGKTTLSNLDGNIAAPDGSLSKTHTLTGQGSVVLVKYASGNNLQVRGVY
jgi:hypothetical protein